MKLNQYAYRKSSVTKVVLDKRDIFLHSKTGQFGYSDSS